MRLKKACGGLIWLDECHAWFETECGDDEYAVVLASAYARATSLLMGMQRHAHAEDGTKQSRTSIEAG